MRAAPTQLRLAPGREEAFQELHDSHPMPWTIKIFLNESESAQPIPLLTTTSGAPVATTEGAELLGITADKLVMACWRAL